jgi:hypothetical protein
MKKFIYIFVIGFTLLCFLNTSFSQDLTSAKKNKAFFTIDVSGSYDMPMLDLRASDDLQSFWGLQDYGVVKGFGTSLNFKFSVYTARMIQLRTYLTLAYSHFSNDDVRANIVQSPNGSATTYGWPYTGGTYQGHYYLPQVTPGISNMRINNPQMAIGCEIGIYTDRANKSCFNLALDYNASLFTGRIYQTYGLNGETFNTISPSLRFGFGSNVAYAYKFDDNFGFHVGTRFQWSNLFGKASEIVDDNGYVPLLDKANTVLNPLLANNRNIAYWRFFGGISIYFGKR